VAFIQVSPPGENGFLSLGISVDIMKEAIRNCPLVIAQVNARMPFSHGESLIDPEEVDFFIHHDEGLLEYVIPGGGDAVSRIGTLVARIIPDGSTIQVGYGRVPNAVLSALHGKKHLGVHTELLGSGIVDLIGAASWTTQRRALTRAGPSRRCAWEPVIYTTTSTTTRPSPSCPWTTPTIPPSSRGRRTWWPSNTPFRST
jgi:acyl-CoA hydrolase